MVASKFERSSRTQLMPNPLPGTSILVALADGSLVGVFRTLGHDDEGDEGDDGVTPYTHGDDRRRRCRRWCGDDRVRTETENTGTLKTPVKQHSRPQHPQ